MVVSTCFLISCLLFLLSSIGADCHDRPVVDTKYGQVIGIREDVAPGKSIDFYRGIPFAQPPVGDLRFEKPQPVQKWSEPLNASNFSKQCVQFLGFDMGDAVSEDCLTLNIATPSAKSSDPNGYPVLVWIYGGGFASGSAQQYHTKEANERVVSRGIVLVSFNYRLGPFGFYSTGNDFAPGNYGLWDQIAALKFVQEVISEFGGDAARVTVFGASAGGGSTSLLTYSPAAAGLFQQVIPMCGCAHANWAQNFAGNSRSSKRLAEGVHCDLAEDVKTCLRSKPVSEIVQVEAVGGMMLPDTINFLKWSPRSDGEFLDLDNGSVLQVVSSVPALYAVNSQEDLTFSVESPLYPTQAEYYPVKLTNAASFDLRMFRDSVAHILGEDGAYGTRAPEAIDRIVDFYTNQSQSYSRHQALQAFTQVFSDLHFNVALVRELRQKAATSRQVHLYVHDYVSPKNRNPYVDGSGHCVDISYVFGNIFGSEHLDDPVYVQNKDRVLHLIESFVKTGKPSTLEGQEVPSVLGGAEGFEYLLIQDKVHVRENLWSDRVEFWDQMAADFGFDWVSGKWTDQSAKDEL